MVFNANFMILNAKCMLCKYRIRDFKYKNAATIAAGPVVWIHTPRAGGREFYTQNDFVLGMPDFALDHNDGVLMDVGRAAAAPEALRGHDRLRVSFIHYRKWWENDEKMMKSQSDDNTMKILPSKNDEKWWTNDGKWWARFSFPVARYIGGCSVRFCILKRNYVFFTNKMIFLNISFLCIYICFTNKVMVLYWKGGVLRPLRQFYIKTNTYKIYKFDNI